MIVIFVVVQTCDLILQLLSLGCSKDFKTEAVGQGHLMLQNIQSAVDYDKSELAIEQIGA